MLIGYEEIKKKLILWPGTSSCNALQLFSEIATACISLHGMGGSIAMMSMPQVDFCSMELHDSGQCG